MSDLTQDLINKRGDTTPSRQAIMKTYILQFMYRDGNGWAFVNATTPNQAEKVFKNQTRYVDARVTAIKETKWYGDSMQVVFEGAVTTYQNINVSISLEDIINSSDAYSSVEDYLKSILGNLYYTAEEIDDKLAHLNIDVDLSQYATKDYVDNKVSTIKIPSIEIKNGYWYINNTNTGVKAKGDDGQTPTISISTDGYWVINNVKTEYKATGEGGGVIRFEDLTQEQIAQLKGVGINNMVAQYALSTSNTSAPTSTWSTTVKTPTASQKYLWARFIVTFTDNTTKTLGPFVLGNYAKDGTGGSGEGSNITVVSSEEDATDENTLYFFDNSLLQGVGLYNTLLQQGYVEIDTSTTPDTEPEEYWRNKKYIACGDSITDPSVNTGANKYCHSIANSLGMTLTNIGISGATMLYSPESSRVNSNGAGRSFLYELLFGNTGVSINDVGQQYREYVGNNYQGPTGINWSDYDLVTIMLGTNDCGRFPTSTAHTSNTGELGSVDENNFPTTFEESTRNVFSNAYEEALVNILNNIKANNAKTLVVLCIPPHAGNVYYDVGRKIPRSSNSVKGIIEELASKYNLPTIDFYTNLYVPLLDSLHPNVDGQANMAERFRETLLDITRRRLLASNGSKQTAKEIHYYHPSNLYKRYDDGSFDILENNKEHGTEVIDNTVYYHYIDKAGLTKKSRTTMQYYGDIMVPHGVQLAQTSDTAYIPLRVTGPFFAQQTPVKITFDTTKLEVYEVTGTTTETVEGITVYTPQTIQVANNSIFNFEYSGERAFIKPRFLLVKRKNNGPSDLQTTLNINVTFSIDGGNSEDVLVMYGKCDIFYKKGNTYTSSNFGDWRTLNNSSNYKQPTGKDYFISTSGVRINMATNYSLNQTKRNVFYVKLRNEDTNVPTLEGIIDKREDALLSNISITSGNSESEKVITYTPTDEYIANRIRYFGLVATTTGMEYSLNKVVIQKAANSYTTYTWTGDNNVTTGNKITIPWKAFSYFNKRTEGGNIKYDFLNAGDTIKIYITPKDTFNANNCVLYYVDGECYIVDDNAIHSMDNYLGRYFTSAFEDTTTGSLPTILNSSSLFGSKNITMPMTVIRLEPSDVSLLYNKSNTSLCSPEEVITLDKLRFYSKVKFAVEEMGVITYDEYRKNTFE